VRHELAIVQTSPRLTQPASRRRITDRCWPCSTCGSEI